MTSRCDHPNDINKRRDRAIRSLITSARTKLKVSFNRAVPAYGGSGICSLRAAFCICLLSGGRADIPDWRIHAVLSGCRGVRRCTRVWTIPRHYPVAALEKPSRHPERKGQGPRRWLGDAQSGRRPECFCHRSTYANKKISNVRFWPIADIASCTAHVRFRMQSGRDRLRMSAFAVAIGGKADMPCCTAYVGSDPKRTLKP